ncbi:TetR/AcrR family transcriptional regulator [Mycolicibacterium litorale]|uniref:Transcriptional regulator n=1 Tax=Mycolicibacterium litorale TaxID=758802 RepID=A0AAD1IN42_9MYCO|nr:TetR/AcrR family transcriptional regulator [Mycolicibacterium litorale]MCV7416971.1 TetR/AcrR family transcriptional regulator [Mycolicibacterium litorale]TDY04756.1 TetR family transcriptional regulator [Mycolicibacterium litorale]BBY18184.1 transcriptional regulator [Mycolicibacterium litorale]
MGQVRPYRGVEAPERLAQRRRRFLEAGLGLLGSAEHDLADLTVRAICRRAGVAVRYFYECFTDKDDFVAAVFDWVINGIATTTQAAAAAAPPRAQSRAVMTDIVRTISEDPRIGRLLFSAQLSNAVVVRKRAESGALFAMLSGRHASAALRQSENDRIKAAAHFVVGGVGQTISAWLAADVVLAPEQLVDQLTAMIDQLADPRLY